MKVPFASFWLFVVSFVFSAASFSWDVVPLWADFGSAYPLTDDQAKFIATHYQVVSLEKCFGGDDGRSTEDNIYETAQQLKQFNVNVKVLFYWHAMLELPPQLNCYQADKVFAQHPDWWFENDDGVAIGTNLGGYTTYYFNTLDDEVKNFWAGVPFSGGPSNVSFIDGVFADSTLPIKQPVSDARQQAWIDGIMSMLDILRQKLKATKGSSLVFGNGLAEYGYPPDGGLSTLDHLDGVCVEHFGAFEMRYDNGTLNPDLTVDLISKIQTTVSKNKGILFKGWPGPCTLPILPDGPSWPNNSQPKTRQGKAAAAAKLITFPLAAFLIIAEENCYFSYAWWYDVEDGYVPCPSDPNACSCPPNFYAEFSKRLGPPLGPAVKNGYVYKRQFQYASVYLDVLHEDQTTITWK